jgi:hypothetical protein
LSAVSDKKLVAMKQRRAIFSSRSGERLDSMLKAAKFGLSTDFALLVLRFDS